VYEHKSEVKRLCQHIEAEIEAMQCGFSAFAVGVARHEFIKARMERIGGHQEQLARHIGESAAANVVCELYISRAGASR
jgi:hypothetical protein